MGACCAMGVSQDSDEGPIKKAHSLSNHEKLASSELDSGKLNDMVDRMISDFTDMIDVDQVVDFPPHSQSVTLKTETMPPLPGQFYLNGAPWKISFKLDADLNEIRTAYSSKYLPIIEQKWVEVESPQKSSSSTRESPNDDDDEIDEKTPAPDSGSSEISIMQWNMLSDALGGGYTLTDTQKTFVGVDKTCLRWTYRGLRVIELLTRFSCDLITIEECDQPQWIAKYLALFGYTCVSQLKTKSPTRHIANEICKERGFDKFTCHPDGVMIAFKNEIFECKETHKFDDAKNEAKVVALALRLVHKPSGKEIVVATTHLKSTKTDIGEQIRQSQVRAIWGDLIAKSGILKTNGAPLPVIFCADLNANPIANKKGYPPLAYNAVVNEFGFESAYASALGSEPPFTTLKQREAGVDRHTIDYIFLREQGSVDDGDGSSGAKPNMGHRITHTLSIPDDRADHVIPSWAYPSDHFCIGARLRI